MDHKLQSNKFYKFAFVDPTIMFEAIFPVKKKKKIKIKNNNNNNYNQLE